ncbi:MAG: hypothetical protein JWP29_148 [Rhodoferax sp.]|nr:hypothetical protein [Rhodoferax sp.]
MTQPPTIKDVDQALEHAGLATYTDLRTKLIELVNAIEQGRVSDGDAVVVWARVIAKNSVPH